MYGVPANLNLAAFVGSQLEAITLGKWVIHFYFAMEPARVIGVEGHLELLDSGGTAIDRQQKPEERDAYRLHRILLREVVSYDVHAPEWFNLTFDNGMTLKIHDDSRQYESFSIQPGDIYA